MRRGTILAVVVIACLGMAGSALAAPPDGAAGPWADIVVDRHVGAVNVGGFVPNRIDPNNALGPAELPPGDEIAVPPGNIFYSLGFGGDITLGFENPICNAPGADLAIEIREVTRIPYPIEKVDVYVSDGIGPVPVRGDGRA